MKRIECKSRDEWLSYRMTGIGASEAPAILGLDPYKGPLAVYAEKVGLVEPSDEETEAMEWGILLQPIVAVRYADKTNRVLRDHGRYSLCRDDVHPWMLASLDFEIVDPVAVLEVKTTNIRHTDDWKDEPPLRFQVQVQQQLAVTGFDLGALVVLVGGQRLYSYDVPRHQGFIDSLIAVEQEFWRRVELKDPPPADGSDATKEFLRRAYPVDDGSVVPLPEEALAWDQQLAVAKEAIKEEEALVQEIQNKIKAAMGEATWGLMSNGVRFSLKTIEKHAKKATAVGDLITSYRELRRVAAK